MHLPRARIGAKSRLVRILAGQRAAGKPWKFGEVLISHVRSIDTAASPIRYAGAPVPLQTARLVRAKLAAIIAI